MKELTLISMAALKKSGILDSHALMIVEKEAGNFSTSCRIGSTRFHEAAQQMVGPCAFVGALGSSCGNVLQFWTLCLVHVLLFCCSHLGVWHLELWRFQRWRNFPLAKLSWAKSPPPPVAIEQGQ